MNPPDGESTFRRNVLIVAGMHVLVLGALWGISAWRGWRDPAESITWLDGGGTLAGGKESAAPEENAPEPESQSEPTPGAEMKPAEPPKATENEPASQIVEPSPTPESTPAPTPEATPEETPEPTPRATPRPTPRATPKPTARPSAKPKPKISPKPKPKKKPSASPKPSAAKRSDDDNGEDSTPAPSVDPATEEKRRAFKAATGASANEAGGDRGDNPGTGGGHRGGKGHAGGGNTQSEFGWYKSMLHDRFYSQWDQPTSLVSQDQRFQATVLIHIEKNGRISSVSLAASSGNDVMDQSVMEAARRVSQVEPLPEGLGDGESYDVKMNFELHQSE